MLLGYNTNGFAHHSLPGAIELLASMGYQSIAISLDYGCLNPYDDRHEREVAEIADLLERLQMRSVVESGARYLLDPRHKHEPTLVSPREAGRPRRVEFLRHAIDTAVALGSDCVSLWSGVLPADTHPDTGMRRLVEGLHAVVDYADRRGMALGFEPEPDMLIDTTDAFGALLDEVDAPQLGLTLDVGHLHCVGEVPIAEKITKWGERIVNVHIEDMCARVHEHLMFGDGEIDFPPILAALRSVGYDGGIHVELSQHSHVAPQAAQQSAAFLRPLLDD